jgi:DNA polymerase-3 subunit epsilon
MNFLVIDLEMSGLDPLYNEIIQIGACLYNEKWEQLGSYSQNVYPENEKEFNAQSAQVHGLSLIDLEDAPLIYEVLPDLEDWIFETANINKKFGNLKQVIVCGQSVIKDIVFLQFAYKKTKTEWPFSNKLIDLHTLSYFYFKILEDNKIAGPKYLSLTDIAGFFKIEREGKDHNALEDAQITADCFKRIFLSAKEFKI